MSCVVLHVVSVHTSSPLQLYQSRVRDLLNVLQACVRSNPSLLGSTVWGMTDIHKVLRSIAPAQKDKPQPLYFVKVGAFTCPDLREIGDMFHAVK